MLKMCLKCGYEGDAGDDPMAACGNCGAIYARVDEMQRKKAEEQAAAAARADAAGAKARETAEKVEAKKRAQAAVLAQRQQSEMRAASFAREQRAGKTRRWFTPQFALVIYILFAVLIGLPLMVAAFGMGPMAWVGFLAAFAILGVGAVVLELILVVFHISTTLEDCRALLGEIAQREP